jgi:outer membrane protein assembly factor BamA
MSISRITIGIVLSLIISRDGLAQSCTGFYKSSDCYRSESKGFNQYGQAKSATVELNKLYKCQVVLYGKKDYIFSLCTESGYKPLHFRIINNITKEVIYDNADDKYNPTIGFSMEKTTNVTVEVEILVEKGEKDPNKYRTCLGIQIWWRKIPKIGFD